MWYDRSIGFGLLTLVAIGPFTAQALAAKGQEASSREPSKSDEGVKRVVAELAPLEMIVGPWSVTESHYNALGELVATVKGTEEITWILDRRAIRRVYTTKTEATVFRAIGTLTWNDVQKKYHGVWFDNVSTGGPAIVKGEWSPETRTMVLTVASLAKDGSTLKYKVVEKLLDEQSRVATTYLIKGTEVVKRMEVNYRRMVPCPDRIRVIYGEKIKGIND